jgi:hypothetical protein
VENFQSEAQRLRRGEAKVRWSIGIALAVATVAIILWTSPAFAATYTESGAIGPNVTIAFACPGEGESLTGGAVTWYAKGSGRVLSTVQLVPNGGGQAQPVTSPRRTASYTATLECEQVQTVDYNGRVEAGQPVTVLCPPETPFLVSAGTVTLVEDHGAYSNPTATSDANGITFAAPDTSGGFWSVSLTCSDQAA